MLGRVVRRGPGVTIEEGTLALLAGTKYAAGVNLCWGGRGLRDERVAEQVGGRRQEAGGEQQGGAVFHDYGKLFQK
jgi:hypothetical protein